MTIISLMSLLGLAGVGLNTAHAICMPNDPDCPPPRPPPARKCTDPVPLVSDLFVVQCKAADDSRCADTITNDQCREMNDEAYDSGQGIIDQQAYNWLMQNAKCAVAYDAGNGYRLQGVCRPGCFAEDTEIMTAFQTTAGLPAGKITSETRLMSLGDKTSPERIELVPRAIYAPTHGPEKLDLFVFTLSNGKRLRVTSAHPMVLADGSVIRANRVQPDALFIGSDGYPVAVLKISREPTTAPVYGFETKSDTKLGHVIVAEGVLVGDLKIQDAAQAELTGLEARR